LTTTEDIAMSLWGKLWQWAFGPPSPRQPPNPGQYEPWSDAWLAALHARGLLPAHCPECGLPLPNPTAGDDGRSYVFCQWQPCDFFVEFPPRRRRLFRPSPKRDKEKPPGWYRPPEKPRRKPGYPGIG
jgi:hypothetical protein